MPTCSKPGEVLAMVKTGLRLSLFDRLSRLLTVLLGAILAALFWFVDTRIDAELYGRFDRGLHSRLNLLANMQGVGSGGPASTRLERWLPEYAAHGHTAFRSEEHTSELQSLMRISYSVFCLENKKKENVSI